MKKLFITLFMVACATCVTTMGISSITSTQAVAKPEKKAEKKAAKPTLASPLGALRWGMDSKQVKKILAEKIMNDFREKANGNTDLTYVDNLMKMHQERVENMQNSYISLVRDNVATLSVSIIGEEFMPDAGESMLTQREDIAMKYFFFKDDKLYKMAIVYDSTYLGPIAFDTFVATTAQKYGEPTNEIWDDDGNFTDAIWKDKSSVKLTVKNKYSSYNTFLMVFADDSVEKMIGPHHLAYSKQLNKGPEVSAAIDALTADDSDSADSGIDAMLGKKTEVDLLAGLSQEDIDVINGKITADEAEKQKLAKSKKNTSKTSKRISNK